jgi:long-chain acyl-CoA synthetase
LVLIPDARNLPNLLQNLDKFKATLFPGVPTMYQMIIRDADVIAGKYNLTSLKACISGSAPLLAETKRGFEELSGAKLLEGYGLSEAPTATHCNPMNGENRIGSIGLPLPDVDCRIVDLVDEICILLPGKIGELLISAPQVMQGYHNMPEETRDTLREGWLCTGDVAYMDKDGYFYLVDRKKELIKVSGFQVWPREVEDIIARHPAVQEVGAAGIPDAVQGEVVKAWVVLRSGYDSTVVEGEIRYLCAEQLIYYKNPRVIEFIDKLPRTGVGKLLRRELVQLHIDRLKEQNKYPFSPG